MGSIVEPEFLTLLEAAAHILATLPRSYYQRVRDDRPLAVLAALDALGPIPVDGRGLLDPGIGKLLEAPALADLNAAQVIRELSLLRSKGIIDWRLMQGRRWYRLGRYVKVTEVEA